MKMMELKQFVKLNPSMVRETSFFLNKYDEKGDIHTIKLVGGREGDGQPVSNHMPILKKVAYGCEHCLKWIGETFDVF